ncbi:MAG: hypothetical protein V1913_18630 [Fibrobacterota bacterium]
MIRKVIPFWILLVAAYTAQAQFDENENTGGAATNATQPIHHRLAFEYGFSHLKNETPSDAPQPVVDFNDKLSSGNVLTATYCRYWPVANMHLGLGFVGSRYGAKATLQNLGLIFDTPSGPDTIVGDYNETVTIYFLGLMFGLRKSLEEYRLDLHAGVRFGYMPLHDDLLFTSFNRTSLSGPSFGFSTVTGFEYMLNRYIGIALGISTYFGSISSLTSEDGSRVAFDKPKRLDRVDINIGLCFHFDTDLNPSRTLAPVSAVPAVPDDSDDGIIVP